MLKKGDFVRVFEKDTTFEESDLSAYDFGGEILEIEGKSCTIQFDSFTLNNIQDEYLIECIIAEAKPFKYIFWLKEVEIMERRDTEEELQVATAKMQQRYEKLLETTEYLEDDLTEEEHEQIQQKWIAEFLKSPQFEQLNAVQKENAEFACEMTMHYMYNALWSMPGNWTGDDIIDLCLEILPRKVSADDEFFENLSPILQAFIQFQGEQGYIQNTKELIDTIQEIEEDIPNAAKNPNNWGMAKSFFGGMLEAGVDINDEQAVDDYILNYNVNQRFQNTKIDPRIIGPSKENPYKHIGRNERINVRYTDGKVVESIKFKKVSQDLLDGKCEII